MVSGSYEQDPDGPTKHTQQKINNISEIWPSETGGAANPPRWTEVADLFHAIGRVLTLYPRIHVAPNGKVILIGPLAQSTEV